MIKYLHLFLLSIVFLFISCGSYSMSTVQSPKVLEPEDKAFGINVFQPSIPFDTASLGLKSPILEIFGRFGQYKYIDFGGKIGFPIGQGIVSAPYFYGDFKYQIIDKPIYTSFIGGFSFAPSLLTFTYAFHTTLLIGTDYLYVGPKYYYLFEIGSLPGAILGSQFGFKYVKLYPELNIYWIGSNKIYVPSIGIGFIIPKIR
jgi:hypothetical protein